MKNKITLDKRLVKDRKRAIHAIAVLEKADNSWVPWSAAANEANALELARLKHAINDPHALYAIYRRGDKNGFYKAGGE